MKTLSDNEISVAYKLIENGDISLARERMRDNYGYDFTNQKLRVGIWCCAFWESRLISLSASSPFEKAEFLVSEWKEFLRELNMEFGENADHSVVPSVRIGIFSMALKNYELLTEEKDDKSRSEIFRKIGLCHKKLGNFDKSLEFLDEANALTPGNAAIIAERGDCYALVGEEKIAKILLKEAFFIDASKIEIDYFDSELICALIRNVEQKKYNGKLISGQALNEWIPVYGVLYNVFNYKRPLKSQEVGRLLQDIYSLENDLKDPTSPQSILVPRLINLYFWLIDYYVTESDSAGKINEILIKIKLQDENIYRQYIK